ncbi:RCS-specific HTH-type transcriptional activator RclR [Paraburkholderia ultramafica]|uniref:RCS-specific HTH-type transcriptional activator RclR n=1 Tax=Paraburkholderia ultramafica TaxID=1544867 RepID=A0A6S7BGC7_9BURK|nr:cupin domain-containing protein [Paraburkholderia ultramafica]CAB3799425.1 RCS-specific HTH-type transcriptional activator RclR [Paraburkholderia ultramafica]
MTPPLDWLSRLLGMLTVRGQLELRCSYGAPWQVIYGDSDAGEMPYHVVLSGSAILETPGTGKPQNLCAGDIVMLPHGSAHRLHDGSGARAKPARQREGLNLTISENAGTGQRLDMLCGRFVLAPPHDRFIRTYLPARLVVRTSSAGSSGQGETSAQLSGLVALMRGESDVGKLGGYAMMNALSAALFALALRMASESDEAPMGLLALAGHPRLAPALTVIFNDPAHPWTLSELADLCNMSRATLIRHFQDKVGRSPNDLLTDVRMALAADELKKPGVSTEVVAETVGYQSVAAFRRVFTQHMGMTPADWRRSALQSLHASAAS